MNSKDEETNLKPIGSTGKLQIDRTQLLGKGSMGTAVHKGKFEDALDVAIKRIPLYNINPDTDIQNEAKLMRQLNHPNIVRYFISDETEDYFIIALELCDGCLIDYLHKERFPPYLYGPQIENSFKKFVLLGIAHGLHYLHETSNIVHGDLKPQNILLKVDTTVETFGYRAVLSDFGLSIQLDAGQRSRTSHCNLIGSDGWRAKEVLEIMKNTGLKVKGRKAMDIFPFGCIIQYVMVEKIDGAAIHPFGENELRNKRIKKEARLSYVTYTKGKNDCLDSHLADILIDQCIDGNADFRPSTKELLKHPFFWDNARRVKFLEKTFNHVYSGKKKKDRQESLMEKWIKYHPHSFTSDIPEMWECVLLDGTSTTKKISDNNSIFNFLRILRNVMQHYEEKKVLSTSANLVNYIGEGKDEDFGNYVACKSPRLFPIVFAHVYGYHNSTPQLSNIFKEYFHCLHDFDPLFTYRLEKMWFTFDKILRVKSHSGSIIPEAARCQHGIAKFCT